MPRLPTVLTTALHLLAALLISLAALPLFLLWRLSLHPLLFLPHTNTNTLSSRAHTSFHLTWQRFLHLPPLALAVQHRARITATTTLLLLTILALALFIQSSIWTIPYLLSHTTSSSSERNGILLHIAVYILSCAPLSFVCGVGAALFYYARKYWKYRRFERNMRRKPGGRGYWVDPSDGGEKGEEHGLGRERGREREKGDGKGKVGIETDMEDNVGKQGERGGEEGGWDEVVLYGGLKEEEKDIRRPDRAVTMPEVVARFERNQFTKDGAVSIWSNKVADKFKGGYDGRKVRRQAWEEILETRK
ncbi:Nn.00g041940.m01.CDS01 [Neocucurbitaria sp. VM-36]